MTTEIIDEKNIDHKVGISTIWTERVVPTEHGEMFCVFLYRKQKTDDMYSGSFPTFASPNTRKRTRKELAEILRNLNKDYRRHL